MGVNKNETGQGGVSNESNQTGMGLDAGLAEGATGSYTYEQKDKMIADVKDQIKELDLRIDTAKRQGDNSAARLLQQDREKLKKQLGEVKKANRDNWDRVQNSTMDMMNQMNLTK
jgi:chaperonin cofactor prefoldin